jgi:hypothetical protein
VDRVRPTTTSSPVTEIEYNDYYEYYDEEKQAPSIAHPKPLKSIDDYDLFPLNNKVKITQSRVEINQIYHIILTLLILYVYSNL